MIIPRRSEPRGSIGLGYLVTFHNPVGEAKVSAG